MILSSFIEAKEYEPVNSRDTSIGKFCNGRWYRLLYTWPETVVYFTGTSGLAAFLQETARKNTSAIPQSVFIFQNWGFLRRRELINVKFVQALYFFKAIKQIHSFFLEKSPTFAAPINVGF